MKYKNQWQFKCLFWYSFLVSLILFLCLNHLAFDLNGFKTGNQFLHKDGYCFSTDDIRVSGWLQIWKTNYLKFYLSSQVSQLNDSFQLLLKCWFKINWIFNLEIHISFIQETSIWLFWHQGYLSYLQKCYYHKHIQTGKYLSDIKYDVLLQPALMRSRHQQFWSTVLTATEQGLEKIKINMQSSVHAVLHM